MAREVTSDHVDDELCPLDQCGSIPFIAVQPAGDRIAFVQLAVFVASFARNTGTNQGLPDLAQFSAQLRRRWR
ncbi:MAG: hypothetical protein QJR12_01170 [Mycobacterium sp.]|uniref:hypothetical protein n=1 Tax=Mycobacterium sp. TaxID=1785 RepID=UPI0026287041|nr:hypothetical protein [Mycobacterium sp.]MDI3312931.1 hypothetical protein [Mycobacterium sp.]